MDPETIESLETQWKTLKQISNLLGPNGKHWIKGASAKNRAGASVPLDSSDAVSWCLDGAIHKIFEENKIFEEDLDENMIQEKVADRILKVIGDDDTYAHRAWIEQWTIITEFNDAPDIKFEDIETVLELSMSSIKQDIAALHAKGAPN